MMRRILVIVLVAATGCVNVTGPFQPRSPVRVDAPGLPLSEQESRSRERYALPDESPFVAPNSGNEFKGFK